MIDVEKWRKRKENVKKSRDHIWYFGDYVKELISYTDHPELDTEGIN